MDFKKIKKFIDLAKENSVTELSYEAEDFKISVNLSQQVQPQVSVSPVVTQHDPAPVAAQASPSDHYHKVKAPFVGTFYSSPAPGEPTFAKVGQKVKKGQTLCILEAMKIMNEIEADVSGKLVEICVDNESFVEYDQLLFKIDTNQ
ncbi:MAG: acetyl-CoA carboxylase biotin carboxyl carrier protein [Halobacteriovoraceae bacterium]|nr:acetyl-CoA carboxylase biotin carboxyl carrier protein [Halobacteriovoraceae bacterium]